jgi:MFS family permease
MRLFALYATSIICGFCLMALEMMGGRFLQPVFGTGIDVWSAIITVFILSLSIGYVLGGRLADRCRTNRALGWIILFSGILYLFLPVIARPFLDAAGSGLHSLKLGVLIAALVLFFVPSVLLGCISPMLVKLVFTDAEKVGSTTGLLYAVGSVGNVLGILVSTYVMLWYLPLNTSMLGMGVVLCLTGIAHLAKTVDALGVKPTALDDYVEPRPVKGVRTTSGGAA